MFKRSSVEFSCINKLPQVAAAVVFTLCAAVPSPMITTLLADGMVAVAAPSHFNTGSVDQVVVRFQLAPVAVRISGASFLL